MRLRRSADEAGKKPKAGGDRRRRDRRGQKLWLLLLLAGCGKSGIAAELAAFQAGGRAVASFTSVDAAPLGAKKCESGTIDQLPVLLCEYASSEAAALGRNAAETWGGSVGTVLVLHREQQLLAVADRNKLDPNGKQISALAKIFRRVK